jgi:CIC family chloride channel protein
MKKLLDRWQDVKGALAQGLDLLRGPAPSAARPIPAEPNWAVVWWQRSFLPSQNFLILLALVIGVLTGLGSVGFIKLLALIVHFSRETLASWLSFLGPANLVLLPTLGGLVAGLLIQRYAREAKGHGVPEVMTALVTRAGKIRKRVAIIKIAASGFTIGFGGAAGREGPMVQIGATLGSAVGQLAGLRASAVRTFVACGAAGGIAATFNAPIGGAIFALEILMGRLHADFLLVLLTSLSSCVIARWFLGNYPAFVAPAYELVSPAELPLYFVLGLGVGLAAVLYVRALYWTEDAFTRWRFPEALKPALGGLAVGLVLRFFPEVYGTGLPAIEGALWVRYSWGLMAALFAAELVANCLTLGSGGSGGVFAPGLYMGAMLGGLFGTLAHVVFPTWTAGSGAYSMVAMGAFFAAAAKAPATALLILFELTNDYRIILPVMAAIVASVSMSHRLLPQSIYTLKLYRRGIRFPYEPERGPATTPPTEGQPAAARAAADAAAAPAEKAAT